MADDTPISIDSAVSLMLPPHPVAKTADGAVIADKPATETPAEDTQAADTSAAADDTEVKSAASADGNDKPVQDDAPAATDDSTEPGSLPLIEAPSGWKAEEKEVFKSLPRAAQEAIARREQDRTTELRNLQNTAAEQRKATDGEVTRLKGLADRIEATVQNQVNDLAVAFPEIKSQADIDALAATDPARFAVFQAKLMRFNAAQQAQEEAKRELATKAQARSQEVMKASHETLLKVFPTWADKTVALKEVTDLQDYAIKLGASEQAARQMHDPIIYQLAHKAKLYDAAQAARAAAVNREAPRTVKPGTSTPPDKGARSAADRAKALAKLDKSGDLEDAVALMFSK